MRFFGNDHCKHETCANDVGWFLFLKIFLLKSSGKFQSKILIVHISFCEFNRNRREKSRECIHNPWYSLVLNPKREFKTSPIPFFKKRKTNSFNWGVLTVIRKEFRLFQNIIFE